MLHCLLRQNAGLYTIWVVPSLNSVQYNPDKEVMRDAARDQHQAAKANCGGGAGGSGVGNLTSRNNQNVPGNPEFDRATQLVGGLCAVGSRVGNALASRIRTTRRRRVRKPLIVTNFFNVCVGY